MVRELRITPPAPVVVLVGVVLGPAAVVVVGVVDVVVVVEEAPVDVT
jgi:hypothetical protein